MSPCRPHSCVDFGSSSQVMSIEEVERIIGETQDAVEYQRVRMVCVSSCEQRQPTTRFLWGSVCTASFKRQSDWNLNSLSCLQKNLVCWFSGYPFVLCVHWFGALVYPAVSHRAAAVHCSDWNVSFPHLCSK